jgi:hypothetical protein
MAADALTKWGLVANAGADASITPIKEAAARIRGVFMSIIPKEARLSEERFRERTGDIQRLAARLVDHGNIAVGYGYEYDGHIGSRTTKARRWCGCLMRYRNAASDIAVVSYVEGGRR